jgi:endoglucanase
VAAQAARVWRRVDPAFAARCLAAARRAWAAAERNPAVFAVGDFTGSGGYGDDELSDERFWAAAELFATTGERPFRDALRGSAHFTAPIAAEPAWPAVAPLGLATLAIVPNALPATDVARLRATIVAAADGWVREGERAPFAIPYASDRYAWGSNSSLLNRAMLMLMAARWTGAPRYRAAAVDVMDYLLGRNPLHQSYVSGHGAKPLLNPHHRFWARQADPAYPSPPPGALSGGPNNTAMTDPVAQRLKGRCVGQRCWADELQAYALNEVAINWNAPLVWVATAL